MNHWRHSVVVCKLYFSHLNQLWSFWYLLYIIVDMTWFLVLEIIKSRMIALITVPRYNRWNELIFRMKEIGLTKESAARSGQRNWEPERNQADDRGTSRNQAVTSFAWTEQQPSVYRQKVFLSPVWRTGKSFNRECGVQSLVCDLPWRRTEQQIRLRRHSGTSPS